MTEIAVQVYLSPVKNATRTGSSIRVGPCHEYRLVSPERIDRRTS